MEYVYFIGHEGRDDTAIKIGWTYDIGRRIDQLQGSVPFKLVCLEYIECTEGNAHSFEQAIHRHLSDRRIHREWFDIRKSEILPAVRAAAEALGVGEITHQDTCGLIPPPGRAPYQVGLRSSE